MRKSSDYFAGSLDFEEESFVATPLFTVELSIEVIDLDGFIMSFILSL